jgi:hypothetical protein
MTSLKQLGANRRNAAKSTGPVTDEGKQRSRRNALRHGLTAETVIGTLEDAEDYKGFEAAVISNYDAQTAVERELALRLVSLLWRLRRATTIETGLFASQADHVCELRATGTEQSCSFIHAPFGMAPDQPSEPKTEGNSETHADLQMSGEPSADAQAAKLALIFLRLANLPSHPLDRLSRYEATLWRQAGQIMFALDAMKRRRPWERQHRFRGLAGRPAWRDQND